MTCPQYMTVTDAATYATTAGILGDDDQAHPVLALEARREIQPLHRPR